MFIFLILEPSQIKAWSKFYGTARHGAARHGAARQRPDEIVKYESTLMAQFNLA